MEIKQKVDLARDFKAKGDFDSAENIYLELLEEYSNNFVILSFLGMLYYEQQKYELAEKYLYKSYCIKQDKSLIKMLAFVYWNLENRVKAKEFFLKCFEFDKSPEIYKKLISLYLCGEVKYKKALEYSQQLYKISPFDIENIVVLSHIYLNIGDFANSVALCNKALSMDNKCGKAWNQRGIIEEVLNYNDEEARKCFEKALKYGDEAEAYYNLALNYAHSDFDKSNYYCEKLLEIEKPYVRNEIMYILGTNYFKQRNMRKGFEYYVHRWENAPEMLFGYAKMKNHWKGEDCQDETLFLILDEGLGDKIMYIRYLPFLAKKFKSIKIYCGKNLLDIFKRSYAYLDNVEWVIPVDTLPECDKSIISTHLPYFLDIDFDNIPYSEGYLIADEKKVEEFKDKYFNTDKLKVGICWESGGNESRISLKRLSSFKTFDKLFSLENVQLYSLQLKSASSVPEDLKKNNIVNVAEKIVTFDDTAAALKNLDIFVTVDTSVAHIAGALGVKTLLLIPYHSEWRWFDNTEKTEWYDSMKLFKQTDLRFWDNEINQIYDYLSKLANK